MDKITMNNACALLEECMINGQKGSDVLYSWFVGEFDLIIRAIEDLNYQLENFSDGVEECQE